MTDNLRVMWFTPNKPENISVGRRQIARHLEAAGITVTQRGTTLRTVVRSLLHVDEYDVVVGTTRSGAFAGALMNLVARTPFVVDHVDPIRQFSETHPGWLATVVRTLENVAFHLADHVLYVYAEERDRVEPYANAATKTDLGVEYKQFARPDTEALEAARNRLDNLQLRENIAIYVGGLEPMYHVDAMLGSVEHLDDWSLLLVGDGTLKGRVRKQAAGNPQVHYLGTVPHERVPGYLHAADVGLSLVDDPHTLKVLEYGAARLPVLQLAGRAEARFGSLVAYCTPDPVDVAAGIEEAKGAKSGDALSEFAAEFDWKEIARTYERVIRAVAGDGSDVIGGRS